MIVSSRTGALSPQFESLLDNTVSLLAADSISRPEYYGGRSGEDLEQDVFDKMTVSAEGGPFDGSISLESGHKFPDIIAKDFYGVEVKSSKSQSWRTTGNSVLETTRIGGIEQVYLLFGKLSSPIGFRWKDYQSCLYEVAVTHSPRYLIGMDTPPEDTIFSKIGLTYEEIRNSVNPIRIITQYYRAQLSIGDDVWWLDTGESDQPTANLRIQSWHHVDGVKQRKLKIQGMALFPEIFGVEQSKFFRFATWLVKEHSVVCPNVRDLFTSGGRQTILVGRESHFVPKIFKRLQENAKEIAAQIQEFDSDVLGEFWDVEGLTENRVQQWIGLAEVHAAKTLANSTLNVREMIRRALIY